MNHLSFETSSHGRCTVVENPGGGVIRVFGKFFWGGTWGWGGRFYCIFMWKFLKIFIGGTCGAPPLPPSPPPPVCIYGSSAVFPKVRSAELFWSARVSNLVCGEKKMLLILYLKSIYHKICHFFYIG